MNTCIKLFTNKAVQVLLSKDSSNIFVYDDANFSKQKYNYVEGQTDTMYVHELAMDEFLLLIGSLIYLMR